MAPRVAPESLQCIAAFLWHHFASLWSHSTCVKGGARIWRQNHYCHHWWAFPAPTLGKTGSDEKPPIQVLLLLLPVPLGLLLQPHLSNQVSYPAQKISFLKVAEVLGIGMFFCPLWCQRCAQGGWEFPITHFGQFLKMLTILTIFNFFDNYDRFFFKKMTMF